ncbi:LysM peptidoglycan-binding domain-containing protein [Enterococcus sp. LJL128]
MEKLSRKERRKAEQNYRTAEQLKKSTTMLGSALALSSIAGSTIILPKAVEATEGGSNSAEISPLLDGLTTETQLQQEETATTEETTEETTQTEETNETETGELPTETTDSIESEETQAPVLPEEEKPSSTDEIIGASPFAASARSAVTTSSFVASIAGHAKSVATANDLYASVMIAQAILESGSGSSSLSQAPYYNLFGIKGSYNGQSVYMNTWEYLNGQWVVKNEAFRSYPSFTESFADNAYVLRNTSFQAGVYYYSGAWKSNTNSYTDATAWLTGRYATDPSYGTKLNSIISANNLTQYDTPSTGGNTGGNGNGGNTGGGSSSGGSTTQDVIHTVVSGDSLWALASRYGTSIANIKSWNNLSSDVIYIGQKLTVQKGSSSGGSTGGGSSSGGNNNSGGSGTTTDTYYTVKSGDSLWAIANINGVSIANLRSWNNISGDIIHPGQRLIVKKGSGGSSGGNTGGGSSSSGGNNNSGGSTGTTTDTYYTVKSGDSLWAIANINGVSIANLRSWNNISGDIIYPGQRLIVKKGSGGSSGGNTGGGSSSSGGNNNSGGSTGTTTDTYYTVKSGDSLWAIANINGVSIANLRSWNNISGDIIYPGQRLVVKKGSGGSSSSGSSSNNSGGSSSSNSKTHAVKSGDTLWGLAQQYSTTVQRIKQLNNLSGDTIYIGQQLKVA